MWPKAIFAELRALWAFLSPRRRRQCGLALVLAIASAAAEMISLALTLPWIATLVSPHRQSRLGAVLGQLLATTSRHGFVLQMTVLFGTAVAIAGALRMLLVWAQTTLAYAIGSDLSRIAFRRSLLQPYDHHVRRHSSDLNSIIGYQVELVTRNTTLPAITLGTATLLVVAMIVAVCLLTNRMALVFFSGLAVAYGIVMIATRRLVRRDSAAVVTYHTRLMKLVSESLGGMRDLILDDQRERVADQFGKTDQALRMTVANGQILGMMPRFGIEALGMIAIAFFAYLILVSGRDLNGAIPSLGLLALSAQRLMPAMQTLYQTHTALRSSSASNQQLLALLTLDVPAPPRDVRTTAALPLNDRLAIDAVSYTYPGREVPALDAVSFTVRRGEIVGIAGTTGSGKSTLSDVILGLLTPDMGSVLVDGVRVDADLRAAWQREIAHVPQSVFLYDGTIASNVALLQDDDAIDWTRLRTAIDTAMIGDEIDAMPDGLLTRVGENGALLSGGQRQRIGIARALYKGGSVLILDEATSALDEDTEDRIFSALFAPIDRPTILLIAHRETTLARCDWCLRMNPIGRVDTASTPDGPS